MQQQKGEYGYISRRKQRILLWIMALTVMAVAIYVGGFLLNDKSNKNVFTMIAVLFALPIAKQLVAYIVLFPYHSTSQERYQQAKNKLVEGMELMTDLVITSPEHIMHLDFVAVGHNQVIALLGKGKQELAEVRAYLSKGVHNWGSNYKVKIVESEKVFLQELQKVTAEEVNIEEEKNVKSYLRSLIV